MAAPIQKTFGTVDINGIEWKIVGFEQDVRPDNSVDRSFLRLELAIGSPHFKTLRVVIRPDPPNGIELTYQHYDHQSAESS